MESLLLYILWLGPWPVLARQQPWGAWTFPHLDLWGLCSNSAVFNRELEGGVAHGLVSWPLEL